MTDSTEINTYGFNILEHLKGRPLDDLKQISRADRLPFGVVCLNLAYDLNIGNTIRTAHLLGAQDVFIVGNNKVDTRACVGSQNYTNVTKCKIPEGESVRQALERVVVGAGYRLAFMEYNAHSKPVDTLGSYAVDLMRSQGLPVALVLGNESLGIGSEILLDDPVFHIPQRGVIRSFNVSSAAAIGIWELSKALAL